MKKKIRIILVLLCVFWTGCNAETTENAEVVETEVHEHSFIYTADVSGTHIVSCGDESCTYSEIESCLLDGNYACEKCGYQHEHELALTSNSDGTHTSTCSGCDYSESVNCTLQEETTGELICTECGWIHQHIITVTSNEDGTHTVDCELETCEYEAWQEECAYSNYKCLSCAHVYPWENDIQYFDGTFYWDKGIFYAQKALNIYERPDTNSEVIGTLAVDEGVYCVGRVIVKDGNDVWNYWVTEDGGCILNEYDYNSNRRDLREGKTTQVVVKKSTLSGSTWSPLKPYAVYDSYDAALQELCGYTWTHIKANWNYHDYKSQGLPYMNSYSEGASGKTVTTRNLVDPYGYSVAEENVCYYFE